MPRALVDEVLQAALWAPSPHHSQPWRLTVLTGRDERETLAAAMADQLARELRDDGVEEAIIRRQTERSRQRIGGAPVAVLCSLVKDGLVMVGDRRRDALEWEMAVQSVGALLQSLFLAARARGLGSCWMAAPMYCPDVVRRTLELSDAFVPQALALLGYAAHPGRLRGRREFDDLVRYR